MGTESDAGAPPANSTPRRLASVDARRLLIGLVACLAIALQAWFARTTQLTDSAALMTLRYAENLAQGNGFVYNVGERVLGTTTPLFALLVALGIKLGLPGLAAARAIGVLAAAALCVVIDAWLRAAGRSAERAASFWDARDAGLLAAFLLAVNPHLIHWSIAGMETSLVVLCGASAWLAYTERRHLLAYGLLGVLFLLRWDTVLLTGVLTAAILWRERRVPVRGLGLFALVVTPWLIFATLYFGNPIPVTLAAKTAVSTRAHGGQIVPLHVILPLFVGTRWDAVISAGAVAGLVLVAVERRRVLWPAAAWALAYWAAYVLARMPVSDRYALPPLPVHVALAAIAVSALHRRAPARWSRGVGYALAGGLVVAALLPLGSLASTFREHQARERATSVAAGLWLETHSAPADRIMVTSGCSVGYFGYYSRRTMIDSQGTVTPATVPFWGPEHASPNYDIASALHPDWCVARPFEIAGIERAAQAAGRSWDGEYQLVESFPPGPASTYQVYRRREPPPRLPLTTVPLAAHGSDR